MAKQDSDESEIIKEVRIGIRQAQKALDDVRVHIFALEKRHQKSKKGSSTSASRSPDASSGKIS